MRAFDEGLVMTTEQKPHVWMSTQIFTRVKSGDDIGLPEEFVDLQEYDNLAAKLKEVDAERDRLNALLSPGGRQEYLLLERCNKLTDRLKLAEELLVGALDFYADEVQKDKAEDTEFYAEFPLGSRAKKALAKWRKGSGL